MEYIYTISYALLQNQMFSITDSVSPSISFEKPNQAKVYYRWFKSMHVLTVLNNHVYERYCPFSIFQKKSNLEILYFTKKMCI